MPEFCMIFARELSNTRIFMIFAPKNNKIPELYMIFAGKMQEFYIINLQFLIQIFGGNIHPYPLPHLLCLSNKLTNKFAQSLYLLAEVIIMKDIPEVGQCVAAGYSSQNLPAAS